jgi:hypothetical protein
MWLKRLLPIPFMLIGVGCVQLDDVLNRHDSGTQIGSLDCSEDLMVIRLRDADNTALHGSVVYVYGDEAPVELPCPYTCAILEPGMEAYQITATVSGVQQTQTVAFEADDQMPATEKCAAYYEKIVRFEFSDE